LLKDIRSDKNNIKIINELDLHGAVIDIAVIDKKYFCGFEIKSDRDTLRRLPIQMQIYDFVLDKITIVVGESKLPGVNRIIPDFWGVIIARNEDGKISLNEKRKPKLNRHISKNWLSKKLWKSDIVNILKKLNLYKGKSRYDRGDLLEILMKNISLDELRYYARNVLIDRVY